MKTKLIPFDIEKAKNGAKVVTRDGRLVRIGFFDLKDKYPIVGAVKERYDKESIVSFTKEGKYSATESNLDLFIEEEVKYRKMTNKELAIWVRSCPEEYRELKYKSGSLIMSYHDYEEDDADKPANYILIRKNFGEWEEPRIEV